MKSAAPGLREVGLCWSATALCSHQHSPSGNQPSCSFGCLTEAWVWACFAPYQPGGILATILHFATSLVGMKVILNISWYWVKEYYFCHHASTFLKPQGYFQLESCPPFTHMTPLPFCKEADMWHTSLFMPCPWPNHRVVTAFFPAKPGHSAGWQDTWGRKLCDPWTQWCFVSLPMMIFYEPLSTSFHFHLFNLKSGLCRIAIRTQEVSAVTQVLVWGIRVQGAEPPRTVQCEAGTAWKLEEEDLWVARWQ